MWKLDSKGRNVRNHIIFCIIPAQHEMTSQCTCQKWNTAFYSVFSLLCSFWYNTDLPKVCNSKQKYRAIVVERLNVQKQLIFEKSERETSLGKEQVEEKETVGECQNKNEQEKYKV